MRTRFFWSVLALALCLPLAAQGAQTGSADAAGGYSWQVLEKVLPAWQPAAGTSGPVILAVRVGSNGEVLYCDARKSSGDRNLDMAACSTVAAAANFPPPPGGLPVEVFLALPGAGVAGQGSGAMSQGAPGGYAPPAEAAAPVPSGNYADTVMAQIRPHLRVPADFKGEAVVVVHLRVDEKGHIVSPEIVEASGTSASVNKAVLDAIAKAGVMPPPPSPSQRMILTFTVRGL